MVMLWQQASNRPMSACIPAVSKRFGNPDSPSQDIHRVLYAYDGPVCVTTNEHSTLASGLLRIVGASQP